MQDNIKKPLKSQFTTGEILVDDSKNSKKNRWKVRKEQSLAVSEAYFAIEELMKYGEKIHSCGSQLYFRACPKGHEKKLYKANFCRSRSCPMCQWRKALATFRKLLRIIHGHRARYTSDIPLFLTLTVPNVTAADLKMMLDKMQKAWDKLTKRAKFKKGIRSFFRSFEITYNSENDTYHPHFHVLLMVPLHYFTRERGLYISRDEWLSMWQESMGMPEIKQVDIRRVKKQKNNKPVEAIIAEVGKYVTKPSSYIQESPNGIYNADAKVVETLHNSLKSRRLIAFGGLFNELQRSLKKSESKRDSPCVCSICKSDLLDNLIFRWYPELRQYIA